MKNKKFSRTHFFNILIGMIGVLEVNLHLLQSSLGEWYGATYIIIAMIGVYLRLTHQDNNGESECQKSD
jgi:protein-S-isoprenylcysteine O-methyltransferase Ste14